MEKYEMFIDGKWQKAAGNEEIPVINPATEEVIGTVPKGGAEDAAKAVEAASRAQKQWRLLTSTERAAILKRTVLRMAQHKEHLATVIVKEQGKPFTEALGEVDGAMFLLEYAANWALHIEGDVLASDRINEQILIMKVPHGVVLGITPWNYPLAVPARKIGPALVTGNTIVLKPHEETPLSALELARLFELEGLPPGVLNVVTGTGEEAGMPLVSNPGVQFITVTGSVRAGRSIYASAANNITAVSLELGGKAPFIVMDDADLDHAVKHAVASRMMNCGQVCICNERTYVHESIYESFLSKFVAELSKIKIGNPFDLTTQLGPKVNKTELDKVHAMVQRAQAQGAEVVTGGHLLNEGEFAKGYWYPPTVLTGALQHMDIVQEEVFGPVVPVMKFSDLDEAISLANDSRYGLSAYLFSNNYGKIMRAIQDIQFGELYINRSGPESFHAYHTGYRNSGVGGDDGKYGIENYLRKKTVYLNYSN
jgi:lactaldehyde dehydrogenase/glycolaldehyde dehydrogenase